jgi:hypothetical protein
VLVLPYQCSWFRLGCQAPFAVLADRGMMGWPNGGCLAYLLQVFGHTLPFCPIPPANPASRTIILGVHPLRARWYELVLVVRLMPLVQLVPYGTTRTFVASGAIWTESTCRVAPLISDRVHLRGRKLVFVVLFGALSCYFWQTGHSSLARHPTES